MATRRVASKNPHFYTFVYPDPPFYNGAVIPKSFTNRYLKGESLESATLSRGGHSWTMEVGCVKLESGISWIFEGGWDKFMQENGIKTGDFIVFRLEKILVLKVTVFANGPSMCERPYFPPSTSDHPVQEGSKKIKNRKAVDAEATTRKHEGQYVPPSEIVHRSKRTDKRKAPAVSVESEATTRKDEYHVHGSKRRKNGRAKLNSVGAESTKPPSFTSTVTQYNITKRVLYIPMKWALSNGLSDRSCKMILKDEKQRSWLVSLTYDDSHVRIGEGCSKFITANGLKKGDNFMLELIKNGDRPVMNFHFLGGKNKKVEKPQNAANSASAHGNYPHFVAVLKQYSFKRSILYLPQLFWRSNNLSNGELTLRNERQSSWVVKLWEKPGVCCITRGWSDFCIGNNLKKGDMFKFELIQKGKKPIAQFTRLSQEKKPVETRR